MHPSRKVYHYRKKGDSPAVVAQSLVPELRVPDSVRPLWEKQKVLQKKIHEIDNRLRFGYSEALYDYKIELIREDVILACELNAALLSLSQRQHA
jgi:hypothetical protein